MIKESIKTKFFEIESFLEAEIKMINSSLISQNFYLKALCSVKKTFKTS